MISSLTLTPGRRGSLSPALLEHVATGSPASIVWEDDVLNAVRASSEALANWQRSGGEVYGTTTGVGPLVAFPTAADDDARHADAILDHLLAGAGDALPVSLVRGAWVLRMHTVALGFSGVRPELLEHMAGFYERDEWPPVPSTGSLGASGDLVPLAHLAAAFRSYCRNAGFTLHSREALALVNGTSFLTATAAIAAARFARLLNTQEDLTGSLVAALGCSRGFLQPELHAARGHPGQIASARQILATAGPGPETPGRPLQERYSLRCAPQVLGAAREVGSWVADVLHREIDGADDNPIIPPDPARPRVWHGGNFHGQLVGFAADALNIAATKSAAIAERQIALIMDPATNGGAPPFLSHAPGKLAGLAGAQLTATALLAEMRQHVHPASADAPESNLGNQDVVSLGFHAALTAFRQMERLAGICAIETICVKQLSAVGVPSPGRDIPQTDAIREGTACLLAPETPNSGDILP